MKNKRKNRGKTENVEDRVEERQSSEEKSISKTEVEKVLSDSVNPDKSTVAKKKTGIELVANKKGQKKTGRGGEVSEKQDDEGGKFRKRKIVSNWSRYEESPVQEDEEEGLRGADYSQLLDAGGGSHFKFRSEASWNENAEIGVSLDMNDLVDALNCIPLHTRLKLDDSYFTKHLLQDFEKQAHENSKKYYQKHGKTLPDIQAQEVIPEKEETKDLPIEEKETADLNIKSEVAGSSVIVVDSAASSVTKESPILASVEAPGAAPPPGERRERRQRNKRIQEAQPIKNTFVPDAPPQAESPQSESSVPKDLHIKSKIVIPTPDESKCSIAEALPTSQNAESVIITETGSSEYSQSSAGLGTSTGDSNAAKTTSNDYKTTKPALVAQDSKNIASKNEDDIDFLLTLKSPSNPTSKIDEQDSDKDAVVSVELPKPDVTVTDISQPAATASLEDWLDSILDD